MRKAVLIVCAVVVVCGGCASRRSINAAYSTHRATPPAAPDDITYTGFDVSYTGRSCATIGAAFLEKDTVGMRKYYVYYDIGKRFKSLFDLAGLGGATAVGLLLSIKPVLGYWEWDDAPEGSGIMLGIRTGLTLSAPKSRFKLITEIGWEKFFDVTQVEDAEGVSFNVGIGMAF